jgi:DNA-directed RNA polymerase specialized sigma24 family protein
MLKRRCTAARFERDAVPLMDQLCWRAVRGTRDRRGAEDLLQATMLRAYMGSVGPDRFVRGPNLKPGSTPSCTHLRVTAYRKRHWCEVEVATELVRDALCGTGNKALNATLNLRQQIGDPGAVLRSRTCA